jgi:hypothetical protein
VSSENGPAANLADAMTDGDLREMLRRALRTVAILGVLLFLVFTFTLGATWRWPFSQSWTISKPPGPWAALWSCFFFDSAWSPWSFMLV